MPHIATGDMLRAHLRGGTDARAARRRATWTRGELVPDALVIEMLGERIARARRRGRLPARRLPAQRRAGRGARRRCWPARPQDRRAAGARRGRGGAGRAHLRPAGRRERPPVARDVQPRPPRAGVCDVGGAPLSRRADDEPDVVRNRYRDVYLAQTRARARALRALGTPEVAIDGTRLDRRRRTRACGARVDAL